MEYLLNYKDEKSDKFWKISIDGCEHTVTFGKTGSAGKSKTKTFDTEEACLKDAEKVKSQKIRKGYVETGTEKNIAVTENVNAKDSATKTTKSTKAKATKKVAQKEPTPEPTLDITNISNPAVLLEQTEKLIAQNQLMAATDCCKALFTLQIPEELAQKAYFVKGKIAYLRGNFSVAEQDLLKSGQMASMLLAKMYEELKQYEKAYQHYEHVNTFDALWAGGMLAKTQDFVVAKKFFMAASEIAQRDNLEQLWNCYLKLGAIHHTTDSKEAERYYKLALDTGKAGANVYNNLAVMCFEAKKLDAALELVNKAIEIHPEDNLAYLNKCCFYASNNKIEPAMEALKKALYYGYSNNHHLKNDKDLKALHSLPEFKTLVAEYNSYNYELDEDEFRNHPERFHKARAYSYTRLKNNLLPEFLYRAHNVESLKVDDQKITKIPLELLQLKKLKRWSFYDTPIKTVPEEFLDRKWEQTELELKRITEFPAYLSRLSGLSDLYLSSVKFTELPEEIGGLKVLTELRIKHSKITCINREIASLSKLRTLELRDMVFDSLPAEIGTMPKLHSLSISDVPTLKMLPEEILLNPELKSLHLYKTGFPATEATKMFEEQLKKKQDRRVIAIFMALIQNNKDYLSKNATVTDVLLALNSSVAMLRTNALAWIEEQRLEEPLAETSEVLVLGKFDISVTEIKAKLSDLGITVAKKIAPTTTHVLVGHKPGDKLTPLLTEQVQWLGEQQIALGNTNTTNEAAVELNPERIEQIKLLLCSTEPYNLLMALELLEENKAINQFEPELFLNYQFQEDAELKKQTLRLAKTSTNKAYNALLVRKFGFKTASEKKVNEYIETIAGEMDYNKIEFAYYINKLSKSNKAAEYLLDNANDDFCDTALRKLIKGDIFELDYDINISRLPDSFANHQQLKKVEINSKNIKELPLPITELTNLEDLKVRRCSLRTIPNEIEQLNKLKKLDLHGNRFTKFPEALGKLKNLEVLELDTNNSLSKLSPSLGGMIGLKELNLESTKIKTLPAEMANLKQLKVLKIADNNKVGFNEFPEVLTQLPALEELEIRIEQVHGFGDNINRIPKLKTLSVVHRYRESELIDEIKENYPKINVVAASSWH